MSKKIVIIGAGFSSLAASAYLAKAGYDVTVLEKNSEVGGRARQLKKDGFTFDIGPTFYWMPDVFEKFFADFGKKVEDYYELIQLDPGYQIYFGENYSIPVSADFEKTKATFDAIMPGSGQRLQKFMDKAEGNYDIAIKDLVYRPGESLLEIVTPKTATKLGSFVNTIKRQVSSYIDHPELKQILEFPVLFLGAKPSNTPSFYNFMNYADLKLGTWHPKGGMYMVVEGMKKLAEDLGVHIKTNSAVRSFNFNGSSVESVSTEQETIKTDIVLSGADYHHTESLLPAHFRQYSESYWKKKTFAPSALLFYVGFDKKLDHMTHHTLFFDTSFEQHAKTIYDQKSWPDKPLFYASFPSMTDEGSAPEGKEAGIFLIPLATDLEDNTEIREKYFNLIIERIENLTGQEVKNSILFKESYCINDFKEDYNSYGGNAYGLANILLQTHILRPRLKSKKVDNLYFTGQLTVPGPGVPPSLISGKLVSDLILKYDYEEVI
ncbi:phytoene desaturase family protein [Jiulongibacter sp. NS-SX5]|uniref:phytoene desaturase family protein n=1 Tax=Jiulongibacter sp. NS-SX5 TaxID=3463854 RepID=UPI0040585FB0